MMSGKVLNSAGILALTPVVPLVLFPVLEKRNTRFAVLDPDATGNVKGTFLIWAVVTPLRWAMNVAVALVGTEKSPL